jgi:hypothetical protein
LLFLEDGHIEATNNRRERELRRLVLGRNYAQSPDMRSRLAAETGVGPFSAGERCALA